MLTSQPLRDLLGRFASSDPTPGGGSAAAVAAALGTSLLLMVTRLPRTRSGSPADRAALDVAAAALTGIQQQLTEAIDTDSAAYDHVVAAYRQPAATDDAERESRRAAIQRALRLATNVPLGVMRLSIDALKHAQNVAAHGHRAAASDVGVALALLQAGLEGARLNVRINLGNIPDRAYTDAVTSESERLAEQIPGLVHEALASLG